MGTGEPERAAVETLHVESAVVHQTVMGRAEQDEVVEGGLATVGPVPDMLAVEALGGGATGEATSAVAVRRFVANLRWYAAGASPEDQRLAVGTINDADDGGSVFDFATPSASVRKDFGIDMGYDFVTGRGKGWCISRFEKPLGHPRQRVGAAHRARCREKCPTWDVGG